jgi:AraC-like DNA-binding protein
MNTAPLNAPAPITTILTESERARVDAAGIGLYKALHRECVDEVMSDLREHRAGAVVVSIARCGRQNVAQLSTMVREFPRVQAVALLSTQFEPQLAQTVLALGRHGVRTLVDVRQPSGWGALRELLVHDHERDFHRHLLAQLADDLTGVSPDCWRFFELIFAPPPSPGPATVRELARTLEVVPSTIMSRFFRARLPAPKRYLAFARLTRAARLFENPGLSAANVANYLEFSSPQSFGRHVRIMLDMPVAEFRSRYDGEGLFHRFREELVLPHRDVLLAFSPTGRSLASGEYPARRAVRRR